MRFEGIDLNLESPLGVEPSCQPLQGVRLAVCLRGLWIKLFGSFIPTWKLNSNSTYGAPLAGVW